jgi:hypothetical protein
MRFSFIITIDPIKDVSYLNVLLHSLNMQSSKNFNVVFYNQTLMSEAEIFSQLMVKPNFEYNFFSIDRDLFLGKYPIWDLYAFHSILLEHDYVHDYFMSLHMEEFLDVDYVEVVQKVLKKNSLDILFGNLTRCHIDYSNIAPILTFRSAQGCDEYLNQVGIKKASHWSFYSQNYLTKNWKALRDNILNYVGFGFCKQLKPNIRGFTKPPWYVAEDVYFMKKSFARKHNWFLRGHHMFFEDVHICQIPGVCELGKELKKVTTFPAYFNLRKIYHISHDRFYFQLEDEEFTTRMLCFETQEPILLALKEAIKRYKEGNMDLLQALRFTRSNPAGTGTQNMNYKYHMMYLNNGKL